MQHPEYGEIIQLQGDQRNKIGTFLVKAGLAREEQIKVRILAKYRVVRECVLRILA